MDQFRDLDLEADDLDDDAFFEPTIRRKPHLCLGNCACSCF